MRDPSVAALLGRLTEAAGQIESMLPAVERGMPWPTGALEAGRGEEHWGPTEVLAHAAEMLPFWLGEIARIVAAPPGALPPIGRTIDDPVRRLTVIRDATLPPSELVDRIRSAVERYHHRLAPLTGELDRVGRHPIRGDLSARTVLERFAVDHLAEHAAQLAAELGGGGSRDGEPPARGATA